VEQASWLSKKRGHQLQTIQTAADVCLGTVRLRCFVTYCSIGTLEILFIIIIIIIIVIQRFNTVLLHDGFSIEDHPD